MRIGIAYDLAPDVPPPDSVDDRFEEFDKPATVEALSEILRGEGHEVILLGDGRELLVSLLDSPPEFVWNLAEGEGIGRCREARVPAVLEMLGIPCTGSDPLTLAVALDKPLAKVLVSEVVAVPRGLSVLPGEPPSTVESRLATGHCGPGPWIVKPAFEGSSKGIRSRSLVDTPAEAAALCYQLANDYRQTILVEEFIAGDEVTVGLVGNGLSLKVIGAMRVRPRSEDPRFVYSLEVKRDWNNRVVYETPPDLPAPVMERISQAALASYNALGCRDVARIDFRVRDGVPYFLEANPLPGLAPDWGDLVILAKAAGLSHPDLIRLILKAALTRNGLHEPPCG
ncbi:MAG: D-alanine--D-alanine ligase [Isosphaeraceae bacterium]